MYPIPDTKKKVTRNIIIQHISEIIEKNKETLPQQDIQQEIAFFRNPIAINHLNISLISLKFLLIFFSGTGLSLQETFILSYSFHENFSLNPSLMQIFLI